MRFYVLLLRCSLQAFLRPFYVLFTVLFYVLHGSFLTLLFYVLFTSFMGPFLRCHFTCFLTSFLRVFTCLFTSFLRSFWRCYFTCFLRPFCVLFTCFLRANVIVHWWAQSALECASFGDASDGSVFRVCFFRCSRYLWRMALITLFLWKWKDNGWRNSYFRIIQDDIKRIQKEPYVQRRHFFATKHDCSLM